MERAWEDLLTGQPDPNPLRDLSTTSWTAADAPDLTLTSNSAFRTSPPRSSAADRGGGRRDRPTHRRGAGLVSNPTFDPTAISGRPGDRRGDGRLRQRSRQAAPRPSRQGHYTPGSIMKVLTAAAALDAGAITPQTTFPDQPARRPRASW